MSSYHLYSLKERVDMIKSALNDKADFSITTFELDFINSLDKYSFGSVKQLNLLSKIEIKIFGIVNEVKSEIL